MTSSDDALLLFLDALLFVSGWMRLYLCKIFARWVYKNTNARDESPVTRRCVAFFPGWMRLYLCKIFSRWVYKNTNAVAPMTSSDDALLLFLDAVLFVSGWMRLYLCKIFARWVYKNTNARDESPVTEHGIPDF
jgi:hypothetical protein